MAEETKAYQGCNVAAYNRVTGKIYDVPFMQVIEYNPKEGGANLIAHRDKVLTEIVREDETAVIGEVVVNVTPF